MVPRWMKICWQCQCLYDNGKDICPCGRKLHQPEYSPPADQPEKKYYDYGWAAATRFQSGMSVRSHFSQKGFHLSKQEISCATEWFWKGWKEYSGQKRARSYSPKGVQVIRYSPPSKRSNYNDVEHRNYDELDTTANA